MTSLFDKLVLFTFCVALYLSKSTSRYAIVIILGAVTLAGISVLIEPDWVHLTLLLVAGCLSILLPEFAYFLPLFVYETCGTRYRLFGLIALFPIVAEITRTGIGMTPLFLLLLILTAWILRYRSDSLLQRQKEYNRLRDEITEKQMLLEQANRDLLEKQDYEVHLATLKERNRISTELHDSIGHVLTSSLLQTGALVAVTPEGPVREHLLVLQKSLSDGMDEVRSSIHDLHDASFDLQAEMRSKIGAFLFCPVKFRYNVDIEPPVPIRGAFLNILREGLSNIARHSDATEVTVIVMEHPAFYQLVIRDNGHVDIGRDKEDDVSDGMGIPGIRKRVAELGGQFSVNRKNGFELFISVPKETL